MSEELKKLEQEEEEMGLRFAKNQINQYKLLRHTFNELGINENLLKKLDEAYAQIFHRHTFWNMPDEKPIEVGECTVFNAVLRLCKIEAEKLKGPNHEF